MICSHPTRTDAVICVLKISTGNTCRNRSSRSSRALRQKAYQRQLGRSWASRKNRWCQRLRTSPALAWIDKARQRGAEIRADTRKSNKETSSFFFGLTHEAAKPASPRWGKSKKAVTHKGGGGQLEQNTVIEVSLNCLVSTKAIIGITRYTHPKKVRVVQKTCFCFPSCNCSPKYAVKLLPKDTCW